MTKLVIYGAPRSKKNSMQVINTRGKPRLIQSKIYREYEKSALKQLLQWGNIQYTGPVWVVCEYWVQDKRKRDLINLLAASHDILQKSAIIKDDAQIVCLDGSSIKGIDREHPRVYITISDFCEAT